MEVGEVEKPEENSSELKTEEKKLIMKEGGLNDVSIEEEVSENKDKKNENIVSS